MEYNFASLQKKAIEKALGIQNYIYLKDNYKLIDITQDEQFQKTFNAFFKVRKTGAWQKEFYQYFEMIKNKKIDFATALKYMFEKQGTVDFSYVSKMLAIIDPLNNPILDQYVLKNLGLKLTATKKEEKIKQAIEIYDQVLQKEKELLKTPIVKTAINDFKKYFPEYNLSNLKILDYYLWFNR